MPNAGIKWSSNGTQLVRKVGQGMIFGALPVQEIAACVRRRRAMVKGASLPKGVRFVCAPLPSLDAHNVFPPKVFFACGSGSLECLIVYSGLFCRARRMLFRPSVPTRPVQLVFHHWPKRLPRLGPRCSTRWPGLAPFRLRQPPR